MLHVMRADTVEKGFSFVRLSINAEFHFELEHLRELAHILSYCVKINMYKRLQTKKNHIQVVLKLSIKFY